MSRAFRCDGCDDFYGGEPAVQLSLTPAYGAIGTPFKLGHKPGVDDAHPADDIVREVTWPFHSTSVQFCANCAAEHIVPGVLRAVEGGRYDDG